MNQPPPPIFELSPARDPSDPVSWTSPQTLAMSSEPGQRYMGRQLLGHLLTVALLALAVRYVCADWDRLRSMASAIPYWLPPVALIVLSNLLARAFLLAKLSREVACPISWRESFCLMAASNMLGMLTLPATGFAYRATYLARRHAMPFSSFAAGTSLFVLVGLLAWSLLGIACFTQIGLRGAEVNRPILLFLLAGLMIVLSAIVASRLLAHVARRAPSGIQRVAGECSAVVSSRRLVTSAAVAMICGVGMQACGFHLVFQSFGLPFTAVASTAIACIHQVGGAVGITPGSVGVQEMGALAVSAVLGMDLPDMVTVLALLRAARMGLSILVGAPCWWILSGPRAHAVAQPHGTSSSSHV